MFQKIAKTFGYDPTRREIERLAEIAEEINRLEPEFEALTDKELLIRPVNLKNVTRMGKHLMNYSLKHLQRSERSASEH